MNVQIIIVKTEKEREREREREREGLIIESFNPLTGKFCLFFLGGFSQEIFFINNRVNGHELAYFIINKVAPA